MGNGAFSFTGLRRGAATVTSARTGVTGSTGVLDLYINEGFVPMVDGALVYHRGFGDRPSALVDAKPSLRVSPRIFTESGGVVASRTYPLGQPLPHAGRPLPDGPDPEDRFFYLPRRQYWASYFPDRTIVAETGSTIRLRVHNRLAQTHELAIHGAGPNRGDVTTGAIAPGATGTLVLTAPAPGTYLYSDPTNAPVERTLGLFGGLVVIDPDRAWYLGPNGPEFERQWLWICHDVVPEWAKAASQGGTVNGTSTDIAPRYFTLNDKAGFQSLAVSDDEELNERREEDTLPSGFPRRTDVRNFSQSTEPGTVLTGQLIRMMNAGIVGHQLHYHGNHVWTVRVNGRDLPRENGSIMADGHVALQQWEDTVSLMPLERKEAILPMFRPPDVVDAMWKARREDWTYPMHCHAEPSQTAAGGLYPGGLVADWVLAANEERDQHHLFESQVDFASDQPHEGSPETLFRQRPNVSMVLDFFSRELDFPDKSEHEVWSFENETSDEGMPGPLVRVREGQVFHGTIEPSKRVHTIHWHGLEPDPRNDGVGHTSFEVTGDYTYQWRPDPGEAGNPNRGGAGTYFYHCHVNTPLHVQMGMFGPIIIDPAIDVVDPPTKGTRRAFVDGPEYDIATETFVGPYSLDPRWHELNHAAGLSGEDAGLNRFRARHFYLLGGNVPTRPRGRRVWSISSMKANTPQSGRVPTLVRMVNVDYFPTLTEFTDMHGKPVPLADVISHDGRPFRETPDPNGEAPPVWSSGSPLRTSRIASGAAEKYDFLLRPPGPGQYRMTVKFLSWVPGEVRATRTITITAA